MSERYTYEDGVAAVIELIGELSFGVDLPGIPFNLVDPITGKCEVLNIHPDSTKPIFDVIYHKLKSNPAYYPFSVASARAIRAEFYLDTALTLLREILDSDTDSTESRMMAEHLLQQCGVK